MLDRKAEKATIVNKILLRRKIMKKILACLLLFALVAGAASALDWMNYPDPISQGDFLITGGVGFGHYPAGDMVIPPLWLSVEYALPIAGIPLAFGGFFTYAKSEWQPWSYWRYEVEYTWYAFGGRVSYHPDLGVKKLDVYGAFDIGYYGVSVDDNFPPGYPKYHAESGSIYWGPNIGARYFFVPMFAAWAEAGYSSFAFVKVGVTVAFKL
jgi:opacity protein-like surface antigen